MALSLKIAAGAFSCQSESYIAPLLRQRFAQLATGAIYDSSPSKLCACEKQTSERPFSSC